MKDWPWRIRRLSVLRVSLSTITSFANKETGEKTLGLEDLVEGLSAVDGGMRLNLIGLKTDREAARSEQRIDLHRGRIDDGSFVGDIKSGRSTLTR